MRTKKEDGFIFKNKIALSTRLIFIPREQSRVDAQVRTIQEMYNPNLSIIVNRSYNRETNLCDYIITITGDHGPLVQEAYDYFNEAIKS